MRRNEKLFRLKGESRVALSWSFYTGSVFKLVMFFYQFSSYIMEEKFYYRMKIPRGQPKRRKQLCLT